MRRTVTPGMPASLPSTTPLLLVSAQTRLPRLNPAGGGGGGGGGETTKPKSTVRFEFGSLSPSVVGSPFPVSVMLPLRTVVAVTVTPLSSLSTSLSGAAEVAMSVLDA